MLSDKISNLDKEVANSLGKIVYYNGKFDEIICKTKEFDDYRLKTSPILNRLDKDTLDVLVNVSKSSNRFSRVLDMIISAVVSGLIVSLVTWLTLHR